MWNIAELVNNVLISKNCAKELFKNQHYERELWNDLDEVAYDNALYFNSDFYEHMDIIASHDYVKNILNKYKVKGDICFGSVEGDNAGQFWGYRFDGKGNMKHLKGNLTWGVIKNGI